MLLLFLLLASFLFYFSFSGVVLLLFTLTDRFILINFDLV